MADQDHTSGPKSHSERASERLEAKALVQVGMSRADIARRFGRSLGWVSMAVLEGVARAPMPATCVNCGGPLPVRKKARGGANKRHCSDGCRRAHSGRKRVPCRGCGVMTQRGRCLDCARQGSKAAQLRAEVRQCVICGDEFTPRWRSNKCCKAACSHILTGRQQQERVGKAGTSRRRTFVCVGCGETVTRKVRSMRDDGKYCSRECAFTDPAWRRAGLRRLMEWRGAHPLQSKPAKQAKPVRYCVECGAPLSSKRWVVCSDECSTKRSRRWYREANGVLDQKRTCWTCGEEFYSEDKRKRFYCGKPECKRRAARTRGSFTQGMRPDEVPSDFIQTVVALKAFRRAFAKHTGAIE